MSAMPVLPGVEVCWNFYCALSPDLHWMNDVERSQYHIHWPSAAGTVTSHCQTSFVEHFCKFYSVINWGTFTSIRLKKKI